MTPFWAHLAYCCPKKERLAYEIMICEEKETKKTKQVQRPGDWG